MQGRGDGKKPSVVWGEIVIFQFYNFQALALEIYII
jgi:hypothetical protein